MSYSRWSNSCWYTFATSLREPYDDERNIAFEIMPNWGGTLDIPLFLCEHHMEFALAEVKYQWPGRASKKRIAELRGYMREFVAFEQFCRDRKAHPEKYPPPDHLTVPAGLPEAAAKQFNVMVKRLQNAGLCD